MRQDSGPPLRWVTGSLAFGFPPVVDANGHVDGAFFDDDPGSSGQGFPSQYLPFDSTHHIWLNELIGAFTDSSGVIVGSPFVVGNGPLDVIIPVGATQLQLGMNDDLFFDNSGSLLVNVTGEGTSPVPEPSSIALLGMGAFGLLTGAYRRRRQQQAA